MGCPECERLRNAFIAVINQNTELLAKFEEAVLSGTIGEIERLRLALIDIEQKRREARVALLAHEKKHWGASAASA